MEFGIHLRDVSHEILYLSYKWVWKSPLHVEICVINDNKLLYDYQFGFQKGKSTYMAMVTLIERICDALDRGDCVIGVFFDFSKAFDTVDHIILMQKLDIYGIKIFLKLIGVKFAMLMAPRSHLIFSTQNWLPFKINIFQDLG